MSFRFRPVLTVFAAAGMAMLISLGQWQLQRRQWKLDLISKVEARIASDPIPFDVAVARAKAGDDMEYTPVEIDGVYAHDLEAHVFGTLDGAPGAYVFTPLCAFPEEAGSGVSKGNVSTRESGGLRFIYVNRGFVPQERHDPARRPAGQVAGDVTVAGLLRSAERPSGFERMFRSVDQPDDNLWFTRDPTRFAARHGIAAAPYYIDSFGHESAAPWPKGGTTRLDFPNRHLEYALTWFGLAGSLFAVWLAYGLKTR